jgi:hypothetical protein
LLPLTSQTYYTTEETLPALIRRSEVVATRTVEITGLENAIHIIQNKTQELVVRDQRRPCPLLDSRC